MHRAMRLDLDGGVRSKSITVASSGGTRGEAILFRGYRRSCVPETGLSSRFHTTVIRSDYVLAGQPLRTNIYPWWLFSSPCRSAVPSELFYEDFFYGLPSFRRFEELRNIQRRLPGPASTKVSPLIRLSELPRPYFYYRLGALRINGSLWTLDSKSLPESSSVLVWSLPGSEVHFRFISSRYGSCRWHINSW